MGRPGGGGGMGAAGEEAPATATESSEGMGQGGGAGEGQTGGEPSSSAVGPESGPLARTSFKINFVWQPIEKPKRKPLEEIEAALTKAGASNDPSGPAPATPAGQPAAQPAAGQAAAGAK